MSKTHYLQLPTTALQQFKTRINKENLLFAASSHAEPCNLQQLLQLADRHWLEKWQCCDLHYAPLTGALSLRHAISTAFYDSIKPEQLLATAGAAEAIFIACQTLLQPGDEVVVLSPCYEILQRIPRYCAAQVKTCSLEWLDGDFHCDIEKLLQQISTKTKLLILNFPHNPTGYLPCKDDYWQLLQHIEPLGVYVLGDEVYRGSEYNPQHRLPAIADVYERGISIGVVSKAMSLPGIRVGWLAMHDQACLEKMATAKRYLSICNDRAAELLAELAVHNAGHFMQRNIKRATENLKKLQNSQSRLASVMTMNAPKAGYFNYPQLHADLDVTTFIERMTEEFNLLFYPSEVFLQPSQHFRLGYATACFEQIHAALLGFVAQE